MNISLQTFLIVCPLVFLAGFVDSIAGGGGIISLPAYMFAGLPMHNVLATNKFSSTIGGSVAVFRYLKNKCFCAYLVLPTVILALIGSTIGSNIALHTDDKYLRYILLFVLPVVAILVFMKKGNNVEKPHSLSKKNEILLSCIAAFVIGGYDGFYGPGTGTFLLLTFTYIVKLDIKEASGNTKCVNFASNIAALVTFILNGKVIFALGIAAAISSILGNYLGSGLVIKNGDKIVRPIILIVIALLFVKIIFSH